MLKLIQSLLSLNAALAAKVQAVQTYDEALAHYRQRRYRQAEPLMRKAAELGNRDAMAVYGAMFLMGQGIKEDGHQALHWLERAVEAGQRDAVGTLGMALASGKAGVPRDLPRAKALLERAAAEGDSQSMRMLGMMDRGEGMFSSNTGKGRR